MLNNLSFKYYSHYIIKFVSFILIYYIILSYIIFNYLNIETIDLLQVRIINIIFPLFCVLRNINKIPNVAKNCFSKIFSKCLPNRAFLHLDRLTNGLDNCVGL